MKIEDRKACCQVTVRQLHKQLQQTPHPALGPVLDAYQEGTAADILRTLEGRRQSLSGRLHLSALSGATALAGGLAACLHGPWLNLPGLAPALLAGAGLAGLASLWTFHRLGENGQMQQGLTRLAMETQASLIQPGPDPTTYSDRRGLDQGLFVNLQQVRFKADDQCLSRHAELATEAPVVFDEDCRKGTVTIQSGGVSRTHKGSLILPTVDQPLLQVNLSSPPSGQAAVQGQDFSSQGWSQIRALSPSMSQTDRLPLLHQPFTWTDGSVFKITPAHCNSFYGRWDRTEHYLAKPLVTAEELGAKPGTIPVGELRYDVSGPFWRITQTQTRDLERGEALEVNLPALADGIGFQPSPQARLAFFPSKESIEVYLGDGSHQSYQGKLDSTGPALDYQSDDQSLRQSFIKDRLQLEAFLPEGRILIQELPNSTPTAELYWGTEKRLEIPIRREASSYVVETEAGTHRLNPAVPLDFLIPPTDG